MYIIDGTQTIQLIISRCILTRSGTPLIEINQLLSFAMVRRKTLTNGLFLIIWTLYQLLTCFVILTFHFWRIVNQVVNTTRRWVLTTTRKTLNDFFVRHINFDHMVNADTRSFQSLSLWNRTWETVKNTTIFTVRLGNTLLNQTNNQFV